MPILLAAAFGAAAPTADAGEDAIFADGFEDRSTNCAPVRALFGSEGGSLSLCGAELIVPPDAVAAPTQFGIERLAAPPPAPFDMEYAGAAFRFTPDDRVLDRAASVRVPRQDARRGEFGLYDPSMSDYLFIEPCRISDGDLQQFMRQLGTFAALRYQGDLPSSTTGLGDGQVTAQVDGVPRAFDIDEPGSWAIYRDVSDGSRLVTINAFHLVDGDQIEQLRIDLNVNAATGSGSLTQISLLGPRSGTYIVGIMGSASISFGNLSDGRIRAHVEATLAGSESVPLQADFDVGVERFIFPSELQCPGQGE
jgi:hypothetical protein